MTDIKERLDNLRIHIQEPEFLEGKGLSNEVNIRIFCYDAEDEMIVRQFIDQVTTDQSIACNLVECNLYETFLSLCNDIDIMDAIDQPHRLRFRFIDNQLMTGRVHIIPQGRFAPGVLTLQGGFPHSLHHFSGQVLAVILAHALQHRFHDDALRAVIQVFQDTVNGYAILL